MKILHYTRLLLAAMALAALAWGAGGCRHTDEWDEVPGPIKEFVNQYFPFSQLESYNESGATYHLRISDGPGLTFDRNCSWIAIDGYGMPLPQVLLFDQLPPALYDYLQESENLNGVFSIERDTAFYSVTLLDSTLRYSIDTGALVSNM